MSGIKRILALLITCTLLTVAAPIAKAATVTDLVGTWRGTNVYYTMTITFYGDYTYETIIDQNGQQYQVLGTFSMDTGFLYFLPGGGQLSALNYYFSGDTLVLSSPQTGEVINLNRQWARAAEIPAGLAGTWIGPDNGHTLFFTLREEGEIVVAYDRPEAIDSIGTFTADNGVLEAEFSDDTYLYLKFMLAGNTLILADEEAEQIVTLTRYQEPSPTAAPIIPTQAPQAFPPQAEQATLAPATLPPPPPPLQTEAPAAVPAAAQLAGTWLGTDGAGARKLILTADGGITLSHEGDASSAKAGLYLADGSTLTATYADGTTEVFHYLLMGETLLLTDSQLGSALTMTRQAPEPTAAPAEAFDPALVGTWGGVDIDTYVEITFSGSGEAVTFIPCDPDSGGTGTYTVFQGKFTVDMGEGKVPEEMAYEVKGDILVLAIEDDVKTFVKKSGPLSRAALPEQPAATTVDAALAGTWGGVEGDIYAETTLYRDGTYEKFVPQDESQNVKGTYMAKDGMLAVLLPSGALQGTYALSEEGLILTWAGGGPLTLNAMPGPLRRTPQAAE